MGRPPFTNTLSVTYQMLFPVATTNYGCPIHKYPLCDFSNVLSCGHNKLWLPCMRSSPRGPLQVYVELRWSYKERFSYKVNGYLYKYKRVYQDCMNHYKLWLQINVTKTHPCLQDEHCSLAPQMRTFKERLLCPECYTTTINYGYPHPQRPSL